MTPESKKVRLTEQDAKIITLVRLLETDRSLPGAPTEAQSRAATERARSEAGDQAPLARFVLLRARKLWSEIRRGSVTLSSLAKLDGTPTVALALAVLAFALGAATDQLGASHRTVNLIAPPLLGVVLWNLLVYLYLALRGLVGLVPRRKGAAPRRTLPAPLASLTSGLALSRLVPGRVATLLRQAWTPAVLPLATRRARAALHLAAASFALGLMASIAVHGWGQSWSAGWESTWLADHPDWVAAIGQLLYGWIPAEHTGLPPLPDLQGWEALRFDRLPNAANAGPWLARMMATLLAFVALPRFLLSSWERFRAIRIERNFPLDLSGPYFTALARTRDRFLVTIDLVALAGDIPTATLEAVRDAAHELCNGGETVRTAYRLEQLEEMPAAETSLRIVLAILPLAATPESDVHGVLMQRTRIAIPGARLHVLLDAADWPQRFAAYPDRIAARQSLWRDFLDQYEISSTALAARQDQRRQMLDLLADLL